MSPSGSLPNHCRDGSEHDPTAQPLLPALLDSAFRRNDGLSSEDGAAHDFGFVAGHEGGDFGYVVGIG